MVDGEFEQLEINSSEIGFNRPSRAKFTRLETDSNMINIGTGSTLKNTYIVNEGLPNIYKYRNIDIPVESNTIIIEHGSVLKNDMEIYDIISEKIIHTGRVNSVNDITVDGVNIKQIGLSGEASSENGYYNDTRISTENPIATGTIKAYNGEEEKKITEVIWDNGDTPLITDTTRYTIYTTSLIIPNNEVIKITVNDNIITLSRNTLNTFPMKADITFVGPQYSSKNTYLKSNVSGNIFIGGSAIKSTNNASNNMIIGNSGNDYNITTGGSNILFGKDAGKNINIGERNILIGENSNNIIKGLSDSIYIGVSSGSNLSDSIVSVTVMEDDSKLYNSVSDSIDSNRIIIENNNINIKI